MRIAIDAHALGRGQAGYESYLRHLTAALPEVAPEDEFLIYRDLPAARLPRLLWSLPRRVAADSPDVLHVQYAAPVSYGKSKLVATIHDVSFEDVPELYSRSERFLLQTAVRRTVRLAHRILTVSEFSRDRLRKVYGLPEDKIVVAYNAAGPQFRPLLVPRPEVPYILMVGDLRPRKNHLGLIQAFSALAPRHPHHLKIAGREPPFSARIRRAALESGVGDRIHFLGYVPDEELPGLYGGAGLCVYPSLYEGFGLPVVEAMACGTPVVTSRTTALPEIAGGAALLADPGNPRDLCQAMEAALLQASRLRAAGLARAACFSWQDAARQTMRAYREAAGPRVLVVGS